MNYSLILELLICLLGLIMGSFAGALVWRLRAQQLREDAVAGENVSSKHKKQVSQLKPMSLAKDRSVCLHCGHQLGWYDLIPLYSWLTLGGKCRYCHKRIGRLEPLLEVGMAVFFVVSFIAWPYALSEPYEAFRLVLWLMSGIGLVILTVYDAKWFLLPNRVVFPLMGIGVVNAFVILAQNDFALSTLINIIDACLILSGLYYLIYVASNHQWVGFGDVKLGLVLALLLGDWQLSLLALFLANAIGTLVVVPLLITGKINRGARIPFGPLLISGWLIAGLFGQYIISSYMNFILGVS